MDKELKDSTLKTETTILGIVCKDGVIVAGDRQTTAGNVVIDKNKKKAVPINNYLVAAGTGQAADIERLKKVLPAELRLKELRSKSRPTVKEAASLAGNMTYSNVRQPSMIPSIVGTIIGGYNPDGTSELYTIEPAGTVMKIDTYDGNFSSGMPYVLGYLERNYKEGISVKEGIKLAQEALKSSTQRDVGSGYGIDIISITKDGIRKEVEQKIMPDYQNG